MKGQNCHKTLSEDSEYQNQHVKFKFKTLNSGAVARSCSVKKMFLKIS